jgi:hypothetical protein
MRIQNSPKSTLPAVRCAIPCLIVLAITVVWSALALADGFDWKDPDPATIKDKTDRGVTKTSSGKLTVMTENGKWTGMAEPDKEADKKAGPGFIVGSASGKVIVKRFNKDNQAEYTLEERDKKDDAEAGGGHWTIQGKPEEGVLRLRSGTVNLNGANSVLGSGVLVMSPPNPQLPATLDAALNEAMDGNPDIATAKAKVKLAEAELNATQMEVTRQIVAKWTERRSHLNVYNAMREANGKVAGSVNANDLIAGGAALDRIEADLRYLIGQPASRSLRTDSAGEGSPRETSKATLTLGKPAATVQLPRGPAVEKVRQALLAPAELNFNEVPLQSIVEYLGVTHKINIQLDKASVVEDTPITINLKAPSLAAAFQAFDDQCPDIKFVIRDYGILVTTPARAREQGYLSVVEFARVGVNSYQGSTAISAGSIETDVKSWKSDGGGVSAGSAESVTVPASREPKKDKTKAPPVQRSF